MHCSIEARLKGAFLESQRCLKCYDPPCDKGCPAGVEVSRFIRSLAKGDVSGAAEVIEKNNPMGLICGWICPHSALCQKECTSHKLGKPIDIRTLQRFVLEEARESGQVNSFFNSTDIKEQRINKNMKIFKEKFERDDNVRGKVAIIGAGPSGLTAGMFLKKLGHEVIVFEKSEVAGGRLTRGIPGFRLPTEVLSNELIGMVDMLDINYGKALGRDFSVDSLLKEGFQVIYISTGKWSDSTIDIKGSNLKGVYSADNILINDSWKSHIGKSAAVIGAGNVAMDVARTLIENKVDNVYVVYRRTQKEMTAWPEERESVWDAGAVFQMLAVPDEILGDSIGNVCSLRCIRTQPVNDISSGRRAIKEIDEFNFEIPVDMVISAVGYNTESDILKSQSIELDGGGHIKTDCDLSTNIPGVFAGGDVIGSGRGTVVQAVGDGKLAALNIHRYLTGRRDNNE